jgi:hypothetical protein
MGMLLCYPYEVRDEKEYFDEIRRGRWGCSGNRTCPEAINSFRSINRASLCLQLRETSLQSHEHPFLGEGLFDRYWFS